MREKDIKNKCKYYAIERQCWRERLIGMPEGKDKEKLRKKLRDSIERSKYIYLSFSIKS